MFLIFAILLLQLYGKVLEYIVSTGVCVMVLIVLSNFTFLYFICCNLVALLWSYVSIVYSNVLSSYNGITFQFCFAIPSLFSFFHYLFQSCKFKGTIFYVHFFFVCLCVCRLKLSVSYTYSYLKKIHFHIEDAFLN